MFDEENAPEGYKCNCGGRILLHDDMWCCDMCSFEAPDNRNTKINQPLDSTVKATGKKVKNKEKLCHHQQEKAEKEK